MYSYLLVSLIFFAFVHFISDVEKHERSIGTVQSCLQMDKRTCKRTIASLHILRDIALVVSYPGCRSFLRRGWSFPAVIRLPSHFIISSPSSRGTPQTGSRSSAPRKKKTLDWRRSAASSPICQMSSFASLTSISLRRYQAFTVLLCAC